MQRANLLNVFVENEREVSFTFRAGINDIKTFKFSITKLYLSKTELSSVFFEKIGKIFGFIEEEK
jgi:hypothetical protein